jgi:hypothetical protein
MHMPACGYMCNVSNGSHVYIMSKISTVGAAGGFPRAFLHDHPHPGWEMGTGGRGDPPHTTSSENASGTFVVLAPGLAPLCG